MHFIKVLTKTIIFIFLIESSGFSKSTLAPRSFVHKKDMREITLEVKSLEQILDYISKTANRVLQESFNDYPDFWIKKLDQVIFNTPLLKSRSDLPILLKKLCALKAQGLLWRKKHELEETLRLIITSKKWGLFDYCNGQGQIRDEAKQKILENRFMFAGNDGNRILEILLTESPQDLIKFPKLEAYLGKMGPPN